MPSRAACERCHARRVKCDQGKPSCHNCERRGLSCPGYQDAATLTWRDEGVRLRRRFECKNPKKHDALPERAAATSRRKPAPASVPCLAMMMPSPLNARLALIVRLAPIANSHVNPRTGSRLRRLGPATLHDHRPSRLDSYVSFIPARLGRNAALDDAVDCLTTTYVHLFLPSSVTRYECLRGYARALRSLRTSLDDKTQRLEAETLCAALLLGVYEVLWDCPEDQIALLHHLRGASHLVRLRGPDRYRSPFERAMLLASQGPTSTESVSAPKGGEGLTKAESDTWRRLMYTAPAASVLEEDRPCQKIKFLRGDSIAQLLGDFERLGRDEDRDGVHVRDVFGRAWAFRRYFYRTVFRQAESIQRRGCEGEDRVHLESCHDHDDLQDGGKPFIRDAMTPDSDHDPDSDSNPHPASSTDAVRLVAALKAIMASPQTAPLDTGAYGNIPGLLLVVNRIIASLCSLVSPAPDQVHHDPESLESETRFLARETLAMEEFLLHARPVSLLYYHASLVIARTALEYPLERDQGDARVHGCDGEAGEGLGWLPSPDCSDKLQLVQEWLQSIRDEGVACLFLR